jgi:hypothetical protein
MNKFSVVILVCLWVLLQGCGQITSERGKGSGDETTNGIALLPSGKPAVGARVFLRSQDYRAKLSDSLSEPIPTAIADSKGRFDLGELDSGMWNIDIRLDSLGSFVKHQASSEGGSTFLGQIHMDALSNINGKIEGAPDLRDTWVRINGLDRAVQVDSIGEFVINQVPQGAHYLEWVKRKNETTLKDWILEVAAGVTVVDTAFFDIDVAKVLAIGEKKWDPTIQYDSLELEEPWGEMRTILFEFRIDDFALAESQNSKLLWTGLTYLFVDYSRLTLGVWLDSQTDIIWRSRLNLEEGIWYRLGLSQRIKEGVPQMPQLVLNGVVVEWDVVDDPGSVSDSSKAETETLLFFGKSPFDLVWEPAISFRQVQVFGEVFESDALTGLAELEF